MLLWKDCKIRDRHLVKGLQDDGPVSDDRVSIKSLKEDQVLEVDSVFARQVERRVHELKCWEIRTLQK